MPSTVIPVADIRFDVLCIEIATRKVEFVGGTNLSRDRGFHRVHKRVDSVRSRVNEKFDALVVPTGSFKKGDIVPAGVGTDA